MGMTVLVCGDRNWTDQAAIERELAAVEGDIETVVNGGARGADTCAARAARKLGLGIVTCLADWKKYGKAAGPKRNEAMLRLTSPDLVLAFHPDITQSKGTKHMVGIAEAAGVPVKVFTA
jgi:hypothetical protein